jgi:hypothetical protein
VEDFLRAYVAGIQLIKEDQSFAGKSLAKWLRENDPLVVKQTVNAYARLFKPAPFVPDKGIDNVMRDLANRRSIPKTFEGRPEIFRDNGPLERVLRVKK